MKKVKMYSKRLGNQTMDSLALFKAALKSNPDALKGLDNLTMSVSLNKKLIDHSKAKESDPFPEYLTVSSEEYEFLKRCVDVMQWGPAILDFEEFIQAIKFPEEG